MMEIPKKGADEKPESDELKGRALEKAAKKGDKDFKEIQKKLGEKIKKLEEDEYYIKKELETEKNKDRIKSLKNDLIGVREDLEKEREEYILLTKSTGEDN